MVQVVVKNLGFTYPGAETATLKDISFEIERGQFVVLFGKTGCGKTTLLRHLKPALVPHGQVQGSVYFEGQVMQELDARTAVSSIGFVMQDPDAQLVTDKVWHELAFGLENVGVAPQVMRMRVAEMASYFGMQGWFEADVAQLSGGQKQLLALASIMVMRPQLLILDEPTSQLDPISAAEFLATVRKINEEFGTTVMLSEHRLEEVYALSDAVLAMDAGTVVAQGDPQAVARQLLDSESELALCLPTPARVAYYGQGAVGEGELPLSVHEGRRWLREHVAAGASSNNMPHADTPGGSSLHAGTPEGAVPPVASPALSPQDVLPQDAPPQDFSPQGASSFAVEMKDVWLRYERDALDVLKGASLAIPEQSIFALVGANGAGKSTLLKSLCGAIKPLRGSIKLFGKKLGQWKRADLFNGTIALLPQDPTTLFVKKTVREELEEMLGHAPAGAQAQKRLQQVSELCAITQLHAMHPLDLSGGEAQRVALAKVLLTQPRILLLDEPTKGIDAVYKQSLATLLAQLKAGGTTIVIASHDLEFCARYADAVALLFNGSIAASGTPRDFFTQASYYTTAANRMGRGCIESAVVEEDLTGACKHQG